MTETKTPKKGMSQIIGLLLTGKLTELLSIFVFTFYEISLSNPLIAHP